MKFLVPRGTNVAADATSRAYFAGIDEIPWQTRVQWNNEQLVVERSEFESGNFFVPYAVEGRGELVLATGSLMEREQPYHLAVELARGTLNRLRNQLAALESMGLAVPANLPAQIAAAREQLSHATTGQHQPDEAARRADLAIRASLDGVWLLNEAYAAQALAARHQQAGRLGTLFGVNLDGPPPGPAVAAELSAACNTIAIPFNWHEIEVREGTRDWSACDAQIDWCRAAGVKVCGGPLLAIDRWSLPDWMYLWGEDDVESFRACVAEHIQAVVSRYVGRVQLWICAARLNVENDFGHGEDERLRLAVMAIEKIRRLDPRSPIVLSIDQPWGAFMSRQECDLAPLQFADALARADLGLAGIGLEINFAYAPGGSEPRDPLEFGRQIDRFSMLGLPLLVSLVVPSGSGPDPLARRPDRPVCYAAGGELSPATQRAWGEQYLGALLAKQPVQAIIWNQLTDSRPHAFAHGGLFDAADRPKPIVELLASLRREHLT